MPAAAGEMLFVRAGSPLAVGTKEREGRLLLATKQIDQRLHRLGDRLGRADGGDEIGVAVPAGDDVPVKVAGQSRAGAAAEVQSDVEAVGVKVLLQQGRHSGDLG